MNSIPVAITTRAVILLSCLLSANLMAHPTNGHECTTITDPVRCFNSDGFCEWVASRCLYRCDIHDGLEDCGQIKEGCRWNGSACIPEPIESSHDIQPEMNMPSDAALHNDVFIVETPIDSHSQDASADVATSLNTVSFDMQFTGTDSTSSPSCRQSLPSSSGLMICVLGAMIWRRSRCL